MATSEIENYIYLLSQGLDSGGEGRFTLNKLPRSKALLEAAELYPYRWVYFAIQSAVCARAASLKVGSNATSVSVEFELAEVTPEFLQSDLLTGESSAQEPAVRFWAQAVLWASAGNPAGIELLCEGQHAGYRVSILGEKSSRSLLTPRERRTRLAMVVNFGWSGGQRLALSAHLEKQLARDMAFVDVPLRLEGMEVALGRPPVSAYRRLALLLALPSAEEVMGFVLPSLLTFRECRVADGPSRIFDAPLDAPHLELSGAVRGALVRTELRTSWNNLSVHKDDRGEWLLPLDFVPKIPGTSLVRAGAVGLFQPGSQPSRLFPVHHGLNLLPMELDEVEPGWSVFWPMPRQPTDFVGLSAVQDEALAGLRDRAVSWLKAR